MEIITIIIKEYQQENKKVLKDVYIFQNNYEEIFFKERVEKIDLCQLLLFLKVKQPSIIKLQKTIYSEDYTYQGTYYNLYIFNNNLQPLNQSQNLIINLPPLQISKEIELSIWKDDYTDWGGLYITNAYMKPSLEDMLQAKIEIYIKKEEGYQYWTSLSSGRDLGKVYNKKVLQDILKIMGVKKIKVKEHERKYYHPTSSHLFGLKDKGWEDQFEIDLENWNIKNKYIVIQDKLNKIEIYVELEA